MNDQKIIGLDYGAKFSGNTAIAFLRDSELHVEQCPPKIDADLWLLEKIELLDVNRVFIDAPLSLPIGYFKKSGDLMYRACDRQTNAMSPMFLGGLTARAISLSRSLRESGLTCFESYPAQLVKELGINSYVKKAKQASAELLSELTDHGLSLKTGEYSIHQIDAALCWFSGQRHIQGRAKIFGDSKEGCIYV